MIGLCVPMSSKPPGYSAGLKPSFGPDRLRQAGDSTERRRWISLDACPRCRVASGAIEVCIRCGPSEDARNVGRPTTDLETVSLCCVSQPSDTEHTRRTRQARSLVDGTFRGCSPSKCTAQHVRARDEVNACAPEEVSRKDQPAGLVSEQCALVLLITGRRIEPQVQVTTRRHVGAVRRRREVQVPHRRGRYHKTCSRSHQ